MSEYSVLLGMEDFHLRKVCNKLIRTLQGLKERYMQSEGIGLANVWDEICVQVQGEYWVCWYAYEHTMTQLIRKAYEEIDPTISKFLSYMYDSRNEDSMYEDLEKVRFTDYKPSIASFVNLIIDELLVIAADYRNARIETYLC
jgi:hypothetical protein